MNTGISAKCEGEGEGAFGVTKLQDSTIYT